MSGKIVTSEAQYLDLLREIYESAPKKSDRTGTGTISVFGREMRFDLQEGFPLLTTKKVFLRSVIHELLWFLQGSGNIEYLAQNNVHIWDEWPFKAYLEKNNLPIPDVNSDEWNGQMKEFIKKVATDHGFAQKWGNLGPVYGVQWREWPDGKGGTVDQIANAIETIKNNPNSRRIIVSAWNPGEIDTIVQIGGLPPCHMLFQFYVNDGKLSLRLDQRSADMFLGVPFNIASYSLLLMMVAQVTGLVPYELIMHFGDAHIYSNHIEQAREQLSREMRELPEVRLNSEVVGIDDFTIDDFELVGYDPHPAIKAVVAV